ncbi:MAG: hypothetical protein ACJAUG_000306 [Halioglobus sp.]|jgi:hypothetical protein
MNIWRQRWISALVLRRLKRIAPPVSDTEREALEVEYYRAGGLLSYVLDRIVDNVRRGRNQARDVR